MQWLHRKGNPLVWPLCNLELSHLIQKCDDWSYSASLGYHRLFMDMYMENDMGWAKENDIYSGPYISLRAKFSSTEKWTYVKKKTEKK